jgi:hypothetical protein
VANFVEGIIIGVLKPLDISRSCLFFFGSEIFFGLEAFIGALRITDI